MKILVETLFLATQHWKISLLLLVIAALVATITNHWLVWTLSTLFFLFVAVALMIRMFYTGPQ